MKTIHNVLLFIALAGITFSCKQGPPFRPSYEIISPDGNVKMGFYMDKKGDLAYTLHYKNAQVIFPSLLGLEMQEGGFLGKNMELTNVEEVSRDDTYDVPAGKSATARDHYNGIRFSMDEKEGSGRKLILEFRAYDDGGAFRYLVPDQESIANFSLTDEKTHFRMCGSVVLWPLELGSFHRNYEDLFVRGGLKDITDSSVVGLPLSFQMPGILEGCITEANLDDYPGMYIYKDRSTGEALDLCFPPHPDHPDVIMSSDHGFRTPWRVIMVADRLVDLIPSNLIINLNEPCEIENTGWIKPGLVAWEWWSGHLVKDADFETGMNDRTMKHYIDFASEFGLEYMLVDAGWYGNQRAPDPDVTTMIPEIDIPGLVKYAAGKNVDIMIWLNWRHLLPKMEKAYALYRDWGVKGVKIDYMNRDDQEMVNLYKEMIVAAARYELLVDFHGAYKPTGIRRTWPNMITREGVLGLEHLKWSDRADPEHNVTIPFTRMLTGPMDYTPGGFDQVTTDAFTPRGVSPMALGTRCHQLAMYVIYESPLQMVSDHPGAYRGQPGSEFLKMVPASWDETLGLDGEIGSYILLARRSGEKWFLGAMTGSQQRELTIDLSFLEEGIKYIAALFTDAEDSEASPKKLTISKVQVSAGSDPLKITMARGGGMAAVLEPVPGN
jgi:alpha-glucosidase